MDYIPIAHWTTVSQLLLNYTCYQLLHVLCNIQYMICNIFNMIYNILLWYCWLGDRKGIPFLQATNRMPFLSPNRKGIRPVKNWVLVCWWWRFDWSFARLIVPVVTTTSITLSSNKIQNGDILVPANPGPPGKWLLKRREREMFAITYWLFNILIFGSYVTCHTYILMCWKFFPKYFSDSLWVNIL